MSNCQANPTNLVPLTECVSYQGYAGGLYGGTNDVPVEHAALKTAQLELVLPRDTCGDVDIDNGKVVVVGVGNSLLHGAFSRASVLASTIKPAWLEFVSVSQSGYSAADMSNPNGGYWVNADSLLETAGYTPEQVQIVWLHTFNFDLSVMALGFETETEDLRAQLGAIVGIIQARYPNVALIYLNPRVSARYAEGTLSPEPYAYEQAFACQLTVNDCLGVAPWVGWGGYYWSDGEPLWVCADFGADGTHLSEQGQWKLARKFVRFWQGEQWWS